MVALRATVLGFAGFAVGFEANGDKGIGKVITMLEELKTETEEEGEKEHKTYDEFACFCKDKTEEKSDSVKDGEDSIATVAAKIKEDSTDRDEKQAEWDKRRDTEIQLSTELKDLTIERQKAAADFQFTKADLEKAIDSIKGAVEALDGGKGGKGGKLIAIKETKKQRHERLVKLQHTIRKFVDEADALSLISNKTQTALKPILKNSLLETGVDPDDADYKFKSQPLIDLLEKLEKDYEEKLEEVEKVYEEKEEEWQEEEEAITDELKENHDEMVTLKEKIDELTEEIADDREDLQESEEQMKDDAAYLEELTLKCHKEAIQYDQRASMRGGEVEALGKALEIMEEKVKEWEEADEEEEDKDDKKKKKFIQLATAPKVVQVDKKEVSARKLALSFLQKNAVVSTPGSDAVDVVPQKRSDKAIAMLSKEGRRLDSTVLTSLAMKLARPDPFKKVKAVIQGLIERLLNEAKTESAHKGFCDEKIGMLKNDRDYRYADLNELHVTLKKLRTKKNMLGNEIRTLTGEVGDLRDDLDQANKLRNEEKAENMDTIMKAKKARDAVKEAIFILKVFYKQAAAKTAAKGEFDEALLQKGPAEDDADFKSKGNYKGNQGKAVKILREIEKVQKEFEKTIAETTEAEETASKDHVEFVRVTEADIGGKEKKIELDKQDKKSTKAKIDQSMDDLKSNSQLLDKALEELKDIKPMCFANGMSYDARVEKREEELAALKLGLCILDPNGDPEDCKKEEEEEE